MKEENQKSIEEALDEINSALNDPKGIIFHQRRLAFLISLGSVALLENYLEKNNVLKPGSKINHQWLKKKKENVKKLISKQLTSEIDSLSDMDNILETIYQIENERNQIAYGKPVSELKLNEKINLFLDLKKSLEK